LGERVEAQEEEEGEEEKRDRMEERNSKARGDSNKTYIYSHYNAAEHGEGEPQRQKEISSSEAEYDDESTGRDEEEDEEEEEEEISAFSALSFMMVGSVDPLDDGKQEEWGSEEEQESQNTQEERGELHLAKNDLSEFYFSGQARRDRQEREKAETSPAKRKKDPGQEDPEVVTWRLEKKVKRRKASKHKDVLKRFAFSEVREAAPQKEEHSVAHTARGGMHRGFKMSVQSMEEEGDEEQAEEVDSESDDDFKDFSRHSRRKGESPELKDGVEEIESGTSSETQKGKKSHGVGEREIIEIEESDDFQGVCNESTPLTGASAPPLFLFFLFFLLYHFLSLSLFPVLGNVLWVSLFLQTQIQTFSISVYHWLSTDAGPTTSAFFSALLLLDFSPLSNTAARNAILCTLALHVSSSPSPTAWSRVGGLRTRFAKSWSACMVNKIMVGQREGNNSW